MIHRSARNYVAADSIKLDVDLMLLVAGRLALYADLKVLVTGGL